MQLPTSDQVNSALRHVYTAAGSGIAVLVLVGLSQGNATALGNGIHQIGDGIASIIAGISALIPVASAVYAAWSASPFSKLLSVSKNPDVKQVVVTTNALAASLPPNVVAKSTGA